LIKRINRAPFVREVDGIQIRYTLKSIAEKQIPSIKKSAYIKISIDLTNNQTFSEILPGSTVNLQIHYQRLNNLESGALMNLGMESLNGSFPENGSALIHFSIHSEI